MHPGAKRRITNRELFARELLAVMVLTVVLMALSVFLPVFYQGDNSESTVTAPWLFIWVQELLRYFPPLSGGVIIPLSILGIMAALPWLPGKGSPKPGRRYCFALHQAFILLTGLVLTLLTCLGL